jgi:hypothetical protein
MEWAWCIGSVTHNAGKLREEGADRRRDGGQHGNETGILTTGGFAEWQQCGRIQDSVTGGVDQELVLGEKIRA